MRQSVSSLIAPEAQREFALLLACTRCPTGPRRNAEIAAAYDAMGPDGHDFVALCNRHHVVAIVAKAIRDCGLAVPRELASLAEHQQTRGLRMIALGSRILQLLRDHGIEAMPIKGAPLSQRLHGDPAIRHSTDIDLLVGWDDFAPTIDLLLQQGFKLQGQGPPFDDWRIALWRKLAKDVTLVDPTGIFAIEVHHRLKTPVTLLPELGIAEATERARFAGGELRQLADRDLFIYLCAHASTSLWDRLKWLVDVHVLLNRHDEATIGAWQARSQELGTGRMTALGLVLARELWGDTLPASVERLERDDPVIRSLVGASLARLTQPERTASSIANTLARRHLMRLRKGGDYRSALWLELRYDRELLERVRLPRRLGWLYLPLRLLLFIRRKAVG